MASSARGARGDGRADEKSADDWSDVRLHVVTGKGGAGKTTVAAALALALAGKGKTVLLCEVEGRQGIAQLFDCPPLPYAEKQIATGPDDGAAVYALAIDAEAALLEYLAMYYRLGRAGKALDRIGVIDFATTVAPGVRDVLLTGKVYEAAHRNRRGKNAREYDAVVLDAPPTGRIAQFLNVNSELAGLAKVGPLRRQSETVMTLLRSRRTAVHLVTLLEDMPVQEAVDAIGELRADRLPVGGVVVNLARERTLDDQSLKLALAGELPAHQVGEDLAAAGVEPSHAIVEALLEQGMQHAQRRALEDDQRSRIDELGLPVYELPRLPDGVDLGGLYELTAILTAQGLA